MNIVITETGRMVTTFTKALGRCPSCRARLDAHTIAASMEDGPPRGPQAGDMLLCWSCAAVLEMTANDQWEFIPLDEMPNRYTLTECTVILAVRNNLIRDIRRRRADLN